MNHRTVQRIASAVIIFVALFIVVTLLAGCGATKQDAGAGEINKGRADVLAMPDGFRNVAHKCDGHGHRVYSASRGNDGEGAGGAVAVIDDKDCQQKDNVAP